MENNPREYKAINLRSGKKLKDTTKVEEVVENSENEEAQVEQEKEKKKEKFIQGRMIFPNNPSLTIAPLPFPKRFQKKKLY